MLSLAHQGLLPDPPAGPRLTVSHFQLCLAHYCDTHGPTPLMVTEGLPVPCSVCYEHDPKDLQRPQTRVDAVTSTTAVIADALKNIDLSTAAPQDVRSQRATAPSKTPGLPRASTAFSTLASPPASPHRPAGDAPSLPIPPLRRDSGFRRTYDDYATKRLQSPCQSCALTLPDQHGAQSSKTAAACPAHTSTPSAIPTDGSTAQSSAACSKSTSATDPRGPTLRTRAPYARVFSPGTLIAEDVATPPKSRDSSSDREGGNIKSRHRTSGAMASRSSTTSSVSSRSVSSHTHFLDYTSTHHPLQPESFSSLRASCLRALSQETLPRSTSVSDPNPKNPTSPTLPNVPGSPFPTSNTQSGFVTTHTSGTAGAGGPMAFGDPVAGFTTAYVFRVHDKYARGNRRLYAFLLLSDHRECQAMSIFGFLSAAFRDMAAWIQALAEETEKREKETDLPPWMQNMNFKMPSLSQAPTNPPAGQPMIPAEVLGLSGGSPAPAPAAKGVSSTYTPLSGGTSFTNGGSRRYVGSASNTLNHRPRGLPELVGMPDFFIHLHAKFVRLLLELGVQLSA